MFVADMRDQHWYPHGKTPCVQALVELEIIDAKEGDIERLNGIVPPKKMRLFREWFRRGYKLIIATHEGRVVYYQWLINSEFYDEWSGLTFRPAPDEFVPIDIYTVPEYKFKNVHLAVVSKVFDRCREIGKYRLKTLVSPEKFEYFKLFYRRAGFGEARPIKRITYRRYLGFVKRHVIEDIDRANDGGNRKFLPGGDVG